MRLPQSISEVNVHRPWLLGLAVLCISLAACGDTDERTGVPEGPFDGVSGAELYAQACATCHGEDLRGTDQGPPFLDPIYEPGHHADQAFVLAALAGARAHHWDFGNMPPIEGITQDQVLAIVDYVREQQRAAGID
jgi:mono/diheme cytochrome c family protein